jgi:curved DNA-binding protein CbpA
MQKITLYEVLGVDPQASLSGIRSAYRKLARMYHPDINPGTGDTYIEVVSAYAVLSDEKRRAAYDASLQPIVSVHDHFARDPSGERLLSVMTDAGRAANKMGYDMVMSIIVSKKVYREGGEVTIIAPVGTAVAGVALVGNITSKSQPGDTWLRFAESGYPGKNGGKAGTLIVLCL